MSEISCEYIIKQKNEGTALYKKLAALTGSIIIAAVASTLSMKAPLNLRLTLILISLSVSVLIAVVSLKFLCVEYEITIEHSEITVTTIYGRFYRRMNVSLALNSISEIGEYNDAAYGAISKLSLQKDYVCLSSLSAPSIFYAIFDDEKDRCIMYFDVTEKAEAILKKQIPSAFRASARRINNSQT